MAHFCEWTSAPWAGVPLPGGMLVPSGRTAMSQALVSASEMLLPSPGESASAADPNANVSATERRRLRVDMFDLPFVVDAPGRDAVVVLVGERQAIGDRAFSLPAGGHEFRAQRLSVAGLVPGAAHERDRLAVPAPRDGEARERLRIARPLQRRLSPALAAIGRHQDLRDPAVTRIGNAGDLVVARPLQRMAERR